MKTIAILTVVEGADATRIHALLAQEVRAAWDGMKSGVVRGAHYLADGGGGVLELETGEAAQAEDFLRRLPLVAAGLVACKTYALAPYTGFDLLLQPADAAAPAIE